MNTRQFISSVVAFAMCPWNLSFKARNKRLVEVHPDHNEYVYKDVTGLVVMEVARGDQFVITREAPLHFKWNGFQVTNYRCDKYFGFRLGDETRKAELLCFSPFYHEFIKFFQEV